MKLLLLEPDVDFSRIVGTILGKSGFHVQHVPTIEEAKAALQQVLYDLAIFAVPAELKEMEALLTHVRAHPAGTSLPIVLMSDVWLKSDPRMTHLVRMQKCQEFLARPFSMLDLADRLRTAAQSGPSDTNGESNKSTRKPDSQALRLFKEIWRDQKTGVLRLKNTSDWALFLDGCTTNTAATDLARKGLYQGSVTFQETNQSGSKDKGFYPMLWEAVLATVKTTFLLQRKTTWAGPAPMYARISEFPVSQRTRDLVSDSTATIALEDLLGDEPSVPQELAALAYLKIIEFQPVEKTVKPKRTPRIPIESPIAEEASPPSIPPASEDTQDTASIRGGQVAVPAKESTEMVYKRLNREWDALANADHYTVLGASPKTDIKVLEGLAARMNKRYSDIVQDENQSDGIRELAQKILTRVNEAENLVVGRKRVVGAPPIEQPQEKGKQPWSPACTREQSSALPWRGTSAWTLPETCPGWAGLSTKMRSSPSRRDVRRRSISCDWPVRLIHITAKASISWPLSNPNTGSQSRPTAACSGSCRTIPATLWPEPCSTTCVKTCPEAEFSEFN
jgi:DNA-binding response OmpR family regulator